MANVLIVGCGDIGIPLASKLTGRGENVWGLRRSNNALPSFINTIVADVCKPNTLAQLTECVFDYVVVTLTPGRFNDEAYKSVYVEGLNNLLMALKTQSIRQRLLLVSSTSVYAQNAGQWVDEESVVEPSSFSGRRLLEAEKLLQESGVNHTIIRFAGIYGPGRHRLIEQVKEKQGCPKAPVLFTNRIHRDDCVGFLDHLITLDQQGVALQQCYIGVDDEPVPLWTVKQWLAEQLGVDKNTLDEPVLTRRNSKRCSNRALRSTGYELQYPTYQQGYARVLDDYSMPDQ